MNKLQQKIYVVITVSFVVLTLYYEIFSIPVIYLRFQ